MRGADLHYLSFTELATDLKCRRVSPVEVTGFMLARIDKLNPALNADLTRTQARQAEEIPQGGGDHFANHRCAGEWLTVLVMKTMLRTLLRDIRYEVPEQDLSIDLARMPALPRSGFSAQIESVRG